MNVIWERKSILWPGLNTIWPGRRKYFFPLVLLILYFLAFIFIAYLNDWNYIKTTLSLLPFFLMTIFQASRREIEKVSTNGKTLFIETKRWYLKPLEVIQVATSDIKSCKFSVWLDLKLVTKNKNIKLMDSSGGDMSTAVLQYLKQFDFIEGIGDTPAVYAKKRLEQKVNRFTFGFGPSEKRQWYAYWVYSIDPQGFGNDLPELKDDYLQALAVILLEAEIEARNYPYPWRAMIRYVPKDMSLNALIFQDLGIKRAEKLVGVGGVEWHILWPDDLKKAFPQRKKYICGREITKGMDRYWVMPKGHQKAQA